MRVPLVRDTTADLMSQTWISYRDGPVVAGDGPRRGVRPGDRVPTHALPVGLRDARLHAVVLNGPRPGSGDGLARALDDVLGRYELAVPVHRERHPGPLHRVLRTRGPLVAVVRPDGHLLFRGADRSDLPVLQDLLHRLLVPVAEHVAADGRTVA